MALEQSAYQQLSLSHHSARACGMARYAMKTVKRKRRKSAHSQARILDVSELLNGRIDYLYIGARQRKFALRVARQENHKSLEIKLSWSVLLMAS